MGPGPTESTRQRHTGGQGREWSQVGSQPPRVPDSTWAAPSSGSPRHLASYRNSVPLQQCQSAPTCVSHRARLGTSLGKMLPRAPVPHTQDPEGQPLGPSTPRGMLRCVSGRGAWAPRLPHTAGSLTGTPVSKPLGGRRLCAHRGRTTPTRGLREKQLSEKSTEIFFFFSFFFLPEGSAAS